MSKTRMGCTAAILATLGLALAGCGGGGGASNAAPPSTTTTSTDSGGTGQTEVAAIATIVQDLLPNGEAVDLADRQYNPMGAGDSWVYTQFDANGQDTLTPVVKLVVSGDAASGAVTVAESTGDTAGVQTSYTVDAAGSHDTDPLGEAPTVAKTLVGSLLDYPSVFYPSGSEQVSVRQGNWGADLDGDGKPEGFRLEMRTRFLGEEDLVAPTSLTPVHVVHLIKTITFTLYPSLGGTSQSAAATEETWAQAGVGLIKLVRANLDADGLPLDSHTLVLKQALVAGVQTGP
jgi:hypothetical protein